jgi:hypothetical protein
MVIVHNHCKIVCRGCDHNHMTQMIFCSCHCRYNSCCNGMEGHMDSFFFFLLAICASFAVCQRGWSSCKLSGWLIVGTNMLVEIRVRFQFRRCRLVQLHHG